MSPAVSLILLTGILFWTPFLVSGQSKILDPKIKGPLPEKTYTWGKMTDCPPKTAACGIQLKFAVVNKAIDKTYINGLRLICSSVGQNDFRKEMPSSLVGDQGNWQTVLYCDQGTMIGFNLLTQYLGSNRGGKGDLFGANNIKILCARANGKKVTLEADGYHAGQYTKDLKCRERQVIRGIQTLVDTRKPGKGVDRIGLVSVRMRCDTVIPPEKGCKANTLFDLILECNNLAGTTPLVCAYSAAEGTGKSSVITKGRSQEQAVLASIGFSASASYGIVQGEVSADSTWKRSIGANSGEVTTTAFSKQVTRTITIPVPAKSTARLFQLTATCGAYRVAAPEFYNTGRVGPLPNPIPTRGFVCTLPKTLRGRSGLSSLAK